MAKIPSNPPLPTIVLPGAGEAREIGPSHTTIKLDAAQTGGHFGMVEYDIAPRFVAPAVWHWHTKDGWAAYVLAGTLSVGFLDRTVEIGAGGVIAVPPNCPFVWSNPSDEPARILFLYGPAGFENYFREVGEVVARNPGVPVKDLSPQLLPLWRKYGIESEG